MKNLFPVCKLFFLMLFVLTAACSQAQQQFTITSSRDNNYCNGTCTLFDVPELNGNPTAVIFVTPVEVNGINLNPHPICAYYTKERWSVINVDNSTIPPGAQFNVQYYSQPDNNHFVHIVTKENLVKSNSYIDHTGLNGNPNAQFQFLQNASPNVRGGGVNKDEINTRYDDAAGKWYITNVSGKVFDFATGYNISISSGTNANTTPVNTTPFSPTTKIDNSGQRVYMTVLGKTQGQFAGENMTNRIEITNFETEIDNNKDLLYTAMIQKPTSPSSIQLFKAFSVNEQLTTVTFEVYKETVNGAVILDYKIVITNARVSSFKQSFAGGQKGFIDLIKIAFRTIEISIGGVSATYTAVAR